MACAVASIFVRRKNWHQASQCSKANNIHWRVVGSEQRGIGVGGPVHKLALASGLVEAIDEKVDVLKVHLPYHESDHVLNIAYNFPSGGTCLADIELLRNDEVYLDGLGVQRLADSETAGDCPPIRGKRHQSMEAFNEVRRVCGHSNRKNFLMKRRSMQTAPWWKPWRVQRRNAPLVQGDMGSTRLVVRSEYSGAAFSGESRGQSSVE